MLLLRSTQDYNKSLPIVELPGRHYHMQIFGFGQIQLQTVSTLKLHYFEAVGVFGDIAVQQIMVDVQQIVDQLPIVFVSVAADFLAGF